MKKLDYKKIEAIILDFDGVLTNNFAYVNEFGEESVRISRADGLAFDAIKYLGLKCYILSSEKNEVVKQRSKKLGIKCFAGIKDKKEKLISICSSNKININRVIYIGNNKLKIYGKKINELANNYKKILIFFYALLASVYIFLIIYCYYNLISLIKKK